jgi:hypothetical protein
MSALAPFRSSALIVQESLGEIVDAERERLQLYCEIVDSAYALLTHERLLPSEESSFVLGPEALLLLLGRQLRLSNDDLIFLEGLNINRVTSSSQPASALRSTRRRRQGFPL